MDWGTLIFNYGRNEVRNFLIANALFWLDEYHIDGLRVDAVASMLYLDYSRKPGEWVPNVLRRPREPRGDLFPEALQRSRYERFPGIMTIAEESTAWPGVSRPTYLGGLGFGFKWNMGWMHDFLHYMSREPIHRRFHQGDITFSLHLRLPRALHARALATTKWCTARARCSTRCPATCGRNLPTCGMFYAWMYAHPGKKLLFMGGEFGQWREWNHDQSLDWHLHEFPEHDGLRGSCSTSTGSTKTSPRSSIRTTATRASSGSISTTATTRVVAFMRKATDGDVIVFVVNATPVVREGYRVGVPHGGWYEEMLNTDAQTYGGAISATSAGSTPSRCRGRADRTRSCCRCRRSPSSG